MKWLKNLLLKFRKKNKPKGYPTQADVQKMADDYKEYINKIERDEKGRWIFPSGEKVVTPARFAALLDQKWLESKNVLMDDFCDCQGKGECKCKKTT